MASAPAPLKTVSQPLRINRVWAINAQTGTSYTPVIGDSSKLITLSNSSSITFTVPPNSSVSFEIGAEMVLEQLGLGQITVAPGAGVTLTAPGPLVSSAQYSKIHLFKVATDTWLVEVKASSNVIARDHTENDVNNTASKTTLYSFTLPANKLGTNKTLAIELAGDYINNSASNKTVTFEIKIGSTVLFADVTANQTTQTTRRPWYFILRIAAKNATNSQTLDGLLNLGTAAGATTGIGDLAAIIANGTGFDTPIYGTASEDSTAALTVTISVTHSAAASTVGIRRERADAYMLGEGQKGDTGAQGAAGVAGQLAGVVDYTADHTLTTSDRGYDVRMTKASAVAVNIDTEANSAIAVGFYCLFSQGGAGVVTATALSGVTLRSPNGAATTAQYDARGLEYLGSNEWRVW